MGKVTAQELNVREQPTAKGKPHPATLKKGDQAEAILRETIDTTPIPL